MSKLYVSASSDAIKTLKTARGHHHVEASVRSYDGSVTVRLDAAGNVEILICERSEHNQGRTVLRGTISKLVAAAATPPRLLSPFCVGSPD